MANYVWNSRFSSLYYVRKLRIGRIVIVKKKYIFELDTPPHQATWRHLSISAIIILNRWKKSVLFSSTKIEMALFSVSEWFIDIVSMNVIRVTLVIHKVNMYRKK